MSVTFEPVQFGKYKLIQPLAQGGMAEIFLAKQQGPAGYEKTVVIKRVLSHYTSHPEFVQMFLDEARLAAQLSHPNIVQIFDFGEVDGSYFLAMELLRGEDLHTLIKLARAKGVQIPPQVAATVIAAACDALHYAHTLTSEDGQPLHIVHRDISPSNLFVTYQGQVKVLDFGIARAEGKVVKTATGVVKGKLAYMAPEQANGQPLDGRGDVWALGAVLHELLTGKRLFWKGNELESFKALLQDPIPGPAELNPAVPRELDEICRKALERDLEHRFKSARAMYEELDDFLSSRTYIPQQTLLSQYLKELVGEEVVAQKLKSPTGSRPAAAVQEPAPKQAMPRTKSSGSHRASRAAETAFAPAVGPAPKRKSSEAVPAVPAAVEPPPQPAPAKAAPMGALIGLAALALIGVAGGVIYSLSGQPPERTQSRPLVVETQTEPLPGTTGATEPPPVPVVEPPKVDPPQVVAPKIEVTKVEPVDAGPAVVAVVVAPKVEPKPARGLLDVNCIPWCAIFLDGKDTTRISPAIGIPISAGKHRLRVVNTPTGIEQEKDVVIHAGATTREVVKF